MTATLTRPSLAERYAAAFPKSRALYERAKAVFPGGVTHDLRLLDPFPVYVDRAKGAHKWTVDGPELIDYFHGHFHGWHDYAVPAADHPYDGTPVPGVPDPVAAHTVVVPPNDLGRVEDALKADPQIGCVILEPTGGHWGLVPVRGAFLRGLRELTTKYDRVLIFDEVITGFRVSPGGAQAHYGVTPDMTTLATILAGGLPAGCVAGRADLLAAIERRPGKPRT